MFIKNLQFAFRNFKKNKVTTAINILGLAVGISASIVIFLIVRYDYSFDKWEPQRENIYRLSTKWGDDNNFFSGVSLLAPKAIQDNVTGIDCISHCIRSPFPEITVRDNNISSGKNLFKNYKGIVFTDENYFKIFPRKILAGNLSALSQLNTVVLSLKDAQKLFPKQSYNQIIGNQIILGDSTELTVTGIVEDLNKQTDFDNTVFVSLKTFMDTKLINSMGSVGWNDLNDASQCFVIAHQGTNIQGITSQINSLYKKNQKGEDPEDITMARLQPLADVHLDTAIDGKISKSTLFNLSMLALLLLLLAVINFINLSTAQSTLRSKEIGVRKTFGGGNKQIIQQFLTETFLVTLFATISAFILSPLLMYVFKGFMPQGLKSVQLFQPLILIFIIILLTTVTLLAGLYPAFVLTKFRPALVLKNQTISGGKSRSVWIRQTLTVFQFVIAQVFLIVVFVIGKQIHFILNKDLGFRKDAIVSFYLPDASTGKNNNKKYVLENELRRIPSIANVSISTGTPTRNGYSTTSADWYNKGKKITFDNVHTRTADVNYINLFDLHLLAGRNIHTDTAAKVYDVLINETLMHQMGYQSPQSAVGQYFSGGESDSSQVVGVIKDFSTQSLHNPVQPTIITADNKQWGYVMAVLLNNSNSDSWRNTLDKTKQIFEKLYPDKDFNYEFLDKTIETLYLNDIKISTLLKWATGLAIFISCLGLLGLVSFMANQRTKEIGIRKVLGATVMQIITLLSKSLVKLVVLASIIAFPIAWVFSHNWLQDFAFKTTLSWWIFIISGIGMLVIALTVLCLRTFKAAKANPVDSLKDE